jgi:L-alanine-DL-glutamate epimerase-like enolase superfamily enzyme
VRIERIDVYGYELTYAHGEYVMSGGRAARSQDSTLVRVRTDGGLEGWGEACPLGGTYLPAFAGGVRAAIAELAPALIGIDPRNLAAVGAAMDARLLGQPFAKSPLDIACWDLLGQAAGLPLVTLLGGRMHERFPLYVAVPVTEGEEFIRARRAEGIRHFQLKVGGDPRADAARVLRAREAAGEDAVLIVDANGGWSVRDALVAVHELPLVHLEQPCRTLAECVQVRHATALPMVYDEVVTDAESLIAAAREGGAGAVNLKIGRVGGLTAARALRDLARSLGVGLTIEDTWGGDVTTAAVSHLAAATHPDTLFTVSFFNDWTREHVAGHRPRSREGFGAPPDGPGLGIAVDAAALGPPLLSVP